eukprot:2288665-Alexandrium_andersonii.AAC.1
MGLLITSRRKERIVPGGVGESACAHGLGPLRRPRFHPRSVCSGSDAWRGASFGHGGVLAASCHSDGRAQTQ